MFFSLVLITLSINITSIEIYDDRFAIGIVHDNGQIQRAYSLPTTIAIWNENNFSFFDNNSWTYESINCSNFSFFEEAQRYALDHPENTITSVFPLSGTQKGMKNTFLFALLLDRAYSQFGYNRKIELVFSVPNNMSFTERYLLQEVAEVIGVPLKAIVDQTYAMSSMYLQKYIDRYYSTRNAIFVRLDQDYTWYSSFEISQRTGRKTSAQFAMDYELVGTRFLDDQFAKILTAATGYNDIPFLRNSIIKVSNIWKSDKPMWLMFDGNNITIQFNENDVNISRIHRILENIAKYAEEFDTTFLFITGKYAKLEPIRQYLKNLNPKFDILAENYAFSGIESVCQSSNRGGQVYNPENSVYFKTKSNLYQIVRNVDSNNFRYVINITIEDSYNCSLLQNNNTIVSFHFDIPNFAKPDENITLTFGIDMFTQPTLLKATLRDFNLQIIPDFLPFMMSQDEFNNTVTILHDFANITSTRRRAEKIKRYERRLELQKLIDSGVDIERLPNREENMKIMKENFTDVAPKPTPKPKKKKVFLYNEEL
ncbi:hypothetical protein TVAG_310380 [Trichomonas vaginalis G3]|uniref:Uncharacterized protein n=1 Tax=Trichomonas vaginalis (strain ATCC PRA-98 / G3) TaxID=412133 RepID=A2EKV4_TRIV3|nr:hypothetical protein TVAG_310380 [Trichomonas vaginalis G3]|eukprot:XP_001318974.1 hypothetical protein [Trichomonas vaginalis G3]